MKSKGVGCCVTLQFDGICTLTHNSTNFDLGAAGANIATAAGEVYTFYEYASADWRLVSRSEKAVGVASGMILMWSGAISAIPTGWVICDGNNSTPNLTDRFVIHASADSGATYDVGDTGGSTTTGTSTLSISQLAAHTHTYTRTNVSGQSDDDTDGLLVSNQTTVATSSTGSGATHTHASTIVPYYALAYIMKS
jgi:microcystin-dependent protein